ncbi:unnamed protein product [Didymodactylos carnosus]|uniref:HAT C-terminal dimerisation domain-containing protein n=1 Tax=Didymodactylos carnosus TaxID=1234261 RepID=A0A814TSM4_9BILA|nr:unnamed protein product [Didymodactylos carnosus]CAF3929853.1 unnamed protein product [Didymodactylos carnosus]
MSSNYLCNQTGNCPVCQEVLMVRNFERYCNNKHTLLSSDERRNALKTLKEECSRKRTAKQANSSNIRDFYFAKKPRISQTDPKVLNDNNSEVVNPVTDNTLANTNEISASKDGSITITTYFNINNYDASLDKSINSNNFNDDTIIKNTSISSPFDVLTNTPDKSDEDDNTTESMDAFNNNTTFDNVSDSCNNNDDNSEDYKQRSRFPNVNWKPDTQKTNSKTHGKPSSTWWSGSRQQWLRAICTNNIYGLLCSVCAQYATDDVRIQRNTISRASAKLTKNDNNTIVGKINAINMNTCTLNYLRALARTFLFMLTQEFALNNFEDLIKLQASNLAEPITKWLPVSNKKQRYWIIKRIKKYKLRDGAFRAILLKRSQEIQTTITNSNNESNNDDNLNDTSSQNNKNNRVQYAQQKPRPKKAIPTPSDTRWIYHYQIISFMWKHLAAVVATLSQIVEKDDDGSPTANGYALQLIDKTTIFEMNINFAYVSIRQKIVNIMNVFDFELYKEKLATIDNIVPTVPLTSQYTRRGDQHKFMESIEDRFNQNCRMVVDNITYFSNPQEYDDNKLIDNELLLFYCNSIHFKRKDTNKSTYEKTENAILNKHLLQKQLPQFRSTIRTITGLLEITKCLSKCDVYRLSEWYKFYQILITIPLGANECEKSFSAKKNTSKIDLSPGS